MFSAAQSLRISVLSLPMSLSSLRLLGSSSESCQVTKEKQERRDGPCTLSPSDWRQNIASPTFHWLELFTRACYQKMWSLAACCSKADKQVGGGIFISDAGNWRVGRAGQGADISHDKQGIRAFIEKGRALHDETAQSALTAVFRLITDGLTSVILVVLGTVNLQFQGWLVSISLRLVLRIVAVYVMTTAWPSCS